MGSLSETRSPRLLFIDAFDSFSNNIIGLLEQSLGANVTRIYINDDAARQNLAEFLRSFDAVIIGPGPGHPALPNDVGLIDDLWKLDDDSLVPVLGICLGFQCLCLNNAAEVSKLKRPRHGIISPITHNDTDIFSGVESLSATNYHSLHVNMGQEGVFWEPSQNCPSLEPLAWDLSDEINGPILMAARHTTKPFWGVQFHPESICTTPRAGSALIRNWWVQARNWLLMAKRCPDRSSRGPEAISSPENYTVNCHAKAARSQAKIKLVEELRGMMGAGVPPHQSGVIEDIDISATDLVDKLGLGPSKVLLLDAQGHKMGKHSIIGLNMPSETIHVTYKVSDRMLHCGFEGSQTFSSPLDSIDDVWPVLQEALDNYRTDVEPSMPRESPANSSRAYLASETPIAGNPFWGGFMGYISYEAGLETIRVKAYAPDESNAPDVRFAFIHRSIVIDHQTSRVYVQSLLPDDREWVTKTGLAVQDLDCGFKMQSDDHGIATVKTRRDTCRTKPTVLSNATTLRPSESTYRKKVLKCQDFLLSGNSYELCLTDETRITVPARDEPDPWMLYKHLRTKNPAPFGAFMDFPEATILSCSPERFLNWSRDGHCQYRPIKGTVKKGPDMTREMATEILSSSKEQAENLMIVDLIRHDLCGIVGPAQSWVSKLMVIEEYETVYQLVSVIEGQLEDQGPRGLDVLSASLPPGSMTGAPKKRSCEILREIERRRRGLYSGVLGYLDVGGGGDFSVVIRTAVRRNFEGAPRISRTRTNGTNGHAKGHHGETDRGEKSRLSTTKEEVGVWVVGAGGAVTVQSTDEGEFLEMETKASSVLNSIL